LFKAWHGGIALVLPKARSFLLKLMSIFVFNQYFTFLKKGYYQVQQLCTQFCTITQIFATLILFSLYWSTKYRYFGKKCFIWSCKPNIRFVQITVNNHSHQVENY